MGFNIWLDCFTQTLFTLSLCVYGYLMRVSNVWLEIFWPQPFFHHPYQNVHCQIIKQIFLNSDLWFRKAQTSDDILLTGETHQLTLSFPIEGSCKWYITALRAIAMLIKSAWCDHHGRSKRVRQSLSGDVRGLQIPVWSLLNCSRSWQFDIWIITSVNQTTTTRQMHPGPADWAAKQRKHPSPWR